MAVVAAAALADLAKPVAARPEKAASWLWVIAAASLIACGAGVALKLLDVGGVSEFLAPPWQMFVGVGLIAAAVCVTVAAARGSRRALAGIIVGTAVERAIYLVPVFLGWYSTSYQEFVDGVLAPPAATRHRVLVEEKDCWDRPALSVRGLRNASGYAVLQPRRILDGRIDAAAEVLEVEWVYSEGHWRQLANPAPYVRLVPKCVLSNQPKEDLEHIDAHDTALVPEDIRLPPGPTGVAELSSDTPGRLLVKTSAGLDRLLAVAESYHPGWQVRIDGAPARPLRLYGDLLGCFVPAGDHRVEFIYHSAALELGTKLSISGFLASVAVFALWRFAARRRFTEHASRARRNTNSPQPHPRD
jgi:hypothetical protein